MRAVALAAIVAVAGATSVGAGEIAPYARGTFGTLRAENATRPLAVHFWSIACLPCLVEMPRLATFAREHPEVAMVFVATDPIAGASRIAARLERFGLADAKTYAYADAFEERLRFEVDRTWRGELPFTALLKPGVAATMVTGELEPDHLAAWLSDTGPKP